MVVSGLLSQLKNPAEPTPEEIKQLKKKLLEQFEDIFSVEIELKPMKCKPMKIELREGAIPTQVSTPRKVGLAIAPRAKAELDDMEVKDLVEKLPPYHPTEWCHPFCPREKPSGGIRMTVDMRGFNEWVKRPTHPLVSPHEAVYSTTPGSRWFSTLDAKNGYFQILLDEASRDLTTFMTPWGRY